VLLHHSHEKLCEIVERLLGERVVSRVRYLPHDDFPLINVHYRDVPVTLATTRMGVDLSLWVGHQLISCGAKHLMKLGTFLSLDDKAVRIGDIYAPSKAIVLPGPLEAYLGPRVRTVRAKGPMTANLQKDTSVGKGTILTYPMLMTKTAHPAYQVDYWRRSCFGLEMECSAVFSVAECAGVESAALLVCNRLWRTVAAEEEGTASQERTRRPRIFKEKYLSGARLALDVLTSHD